MSDKALLTHIRAIHAEVKAEYGWPKMWKELVARGHRVGKERVRRLMQLHGIRVRCKRKFVVTTDSKQHLPIAPDLVQRNFTMTAPNQAWDCDITLYLVAVTTCSRHTRRGQHGHYVRLRAWDVDVAPRLTFAP